MFKNEEYIKQRKALWIKSFEALKEMMKKLTKNSQRAC